jgi:uncharacterized membrane protein YjgN (DUF898 family)
MIMEKLIEMYKSALNKNADIKQIKNCIESMDTYLLCNVLLRTDKTVNDSYRFASVRPSAYKQFLAGELKNHEKQLKVIEDNIKRSIK